MIERVPFQVEHATEIAAGNLKDSREKPLDLAEWAKDAATGGPAYSLSADGQIVACGGIRTLWTGYGEAWMLVADGASAYRRRLAVLTKQTIDEIMEAAELVRVEANVRCDRDDFIHWVQFLGFSCIAKRRHYGPDGADYFLFERMRWR